jgi:fucose 4-O-acetylase-like acetyltransferase
MSAQVQAESRGEGRIQVLDFIKGVCIFGVVLGHVIQHCYFDVSFFENPLFKFIYSFHMPMFMIIGGFLFYFSMEKFRRVGGTNVLTYVRSYLHTQKRLYVPIVVFTIMITALGSLISATKGDAQALNWLNNLGSIWFLWCLLAYYLCVGISYCCVIGRKYKAVWFLLMILLSSPLLLLFPNMKMVLYHYPYFLAGFLLSMFKDKVKGAFKFKYVAIPIFISCLYFYKTEYYIYNSDFLPSSVSEISSVLALDLFRYAFGFSACVSVYIVCELYIRFVKRVSAVARIGRITLEIYLVQSILLEAIFVGVYKRVFDYNVLAFGNKWLFTIAVAPILALSLVALMTIVIEKLNKRGIGKAIFHGEV